jgi:hypothetical protein
MSLGPYATEPRDKGRLRVSHNHSVIIERNQERCDRWHSNNVCHAGLIGAKGGN